jgi:flavin reductase (DIM6/NTAB) family NADH-FMN oxidoreductase RutF
MVDLDAFHDLAGDLDQPMLVVTTAVGEQRAGCLVGFSTQCSIDPPRFLVLLSDKNHTYRVALDAEALAVHVLGEDDLALAELFGQETGDDVDKFTRCDWSPGPAGVPILAGCDAWFVGRVLERERLGDHVAHVLEPIAAERRARVVPLTLRDVAHLEPGHEA